jgi:hypothetical protein
MSARAAIVASKSIKLGKLARAGAIQNYQGVSAAQTACLSFLEPQANYLT